MARLQGVEDNPVPVTVKGAHQFARVADRAHALGRLLQLLRMLGTAQVVNGAGKGGISDVQEDRGEGGEGLEVGVVGQEALGCDGAYATAGV
eukprot:CAMPEP_0173278252 /NCGR_PEP_ID=MMETSP1143-20121109/4517_1 /TAXON_ID=483371 /ORGANISM="non described non described, Strain CCMP2298" /LENGTH=91 /DNA_ID=CAMNT_0014215403 /DNA_START=637 /DNA_END=913 /DNA_ORIENTATION=-